MTFTELGVSHILIMCPRGFINERQAIPIPCHMAGEAEAMWDFTNPSRDVNLTWLYRLEDCPSAYRSMAGLTIREFDTPAEYEEWLRMEKGFNNE